MGPSVAQAHGLGPSKNYMDCVHGPPVFITPKNTMVN